MMELFREIRRLCQAAWLELRPRAADSRLKVLHGWPVTIIAREETEAEMRARDPGKRSPMPIYFAGDTLVWRGGAEYLGFAITIMGQPVKPGEDTRVPGVRRRAGGLLYWRLDVSVQVGDLNRVTNQWGSVADLVAVDEMPVTTYPLLRVSDQTDYAGLMVARQRGTIWQLCAQYSAAGEVTLYQSLPNRGYAGAYWNLTA